MYVEVKTTEDDWQIKIEMQTGDRLGFTHREGRGTFVSFTREGFIKILYDTLSWWPAVIPREHYPEVVGFLGSILFTEDDLSPDAWREIKFSMLLLSKEVFAQQNERMQFVVTMPFRTFVAMAICNLSARPQIELDHFGKDFKLMFLKHWRGVLSILRQRASGSPVI